MRIASWKSYLDHYQPFRNTLVISVAFSVVRSLFVVPIALLVRYIFDNAIPTGEITSLWMGGSAILLLHIANSGVTLWIQYVAVRAVKSVTYQLRIELIEKLYTLSRQYYSKGDGSTLHASIIQETSRLDFMGEVLITRLLPGLVGTVALSGLLIYLNARLFLILICVGPIFYLVAKWLGRLVRQRADAKHRAFEAFSRGVLFVLQRMDLTRILAAERVELERQRQHLDQLRHTARSLSWLSTAQTLLQNALVTAAIALILVLGGLSILAERMTVGELLAYYLAAGLLANSLHDVSFTIPQVISGNESLRTMSKVLAIDDTRPYAGRKRIDFRGEICLENVGFTYGDDFALHDINILTRPGSISALVGPNGAGKTTIMNIVLGFNRPQSGRLCADGVPFDELDIPHLRRQMGVVTQHSIIFPGTIWDNISYGSPDISRDQMIRAAQQATAHDFIEALPSGYHTQVGEDGLLLSGGQRQRIALARALLHDQVLLILDEPAKHLDEDGVRELMRNLKNLAHHPAVLVISHDAAIVSEAQQFYVLRYGRIVEAVETPSSASLEFDAGAA
ncbi:MAG: ABC transporter ATP-binding protein [Anaerolineales bacterium]|jgi:ABC-type bacteriocin/lantibiotic exporter with double-glycine peptidase domain